MLILPFVLALLLLIARLFFSPLPFEFLLFSSCTPNGILYYFYLAFQLRVYRFLTSPLLGFSASRLLGFSVIQLFGLSFFFGFPYFPPLLFTPLFLIPTRHGERAPSDS